MPEGEVERAELPEASSGGGMAEADWIPERERRQMEQILELDMEELQVEEVGDSGSSSSSDVATFLRNTHGNGETSTSEELTFNMSQASLRTYVGEVNDTRARFAFLNGGTVLSFPMFYLQGVVLFPEAALTLRVIQPRFLATVDKAINHVDAPGMIGVVHVYQHVNDGHHAIALVGTTAEIQQIKRLDDGSSNVITRGQQRFCLRRSWIDADEVPWGEVQIIEEDMPLRTPGDAFEQLAVSHTFKKCDSSVPSFGVSSFRQKDLVDSDLDLDSLSSTSTSSDRSATDTRIYYSSNEDEDLMCELSWQKHDSVNEFGALGHPVKNTNLGDDDDLCFASPKSLSTVRKKGAERQRRYHVAYNSRLALEAPLSFWPRWAYEMYDSYSLARRAADLWRQIIANPSMDDHVIKPDMLSFHIGTHLPMSGSVRQELLEIDGISYRLQREIQLLKAFNLIRCRNCLALIARRSDVVMPSDSPVGAYVKSYNCAQEVITVYNATGLALHGNSSEAHRWFPGYTWTIAMCVACESNIGWLFRADKRNLLPKSFWGIRSSQISDDTQSTQD